MQLRQLAIAMQAQVDRALVQVLVEHSVLALPQHVAAEVLEAGGTKCAVGANFSNQLAVRTMWEPRRGTWMEREVGEPVVSQSDRVAKRISVEVAPNDGGTRGQQFDADPEPASPRAVGP